MASEARGCITIKQAGRSYLLGGERLEVLRGIDLQIEPGTFTSIIGQSGCGKSTLLRLIAGLEPPSSGQVIFQGEEITGPSLDIGVLFQDSRLLPWYSVEQNIDFGLPRRIKRAERRELVQKHIALVGLKGFEKALPEQLSGGMKKRVSIARTIINNPQVLLLDEPFGALDAFTKISLQDEVHKLCRAAGITTILVTHDIDEAVYLGNQVVIMSNKPGSIKKVIPVDLPEPRERTSATFYQYRKEIYEEFFYMSKSDIEFFI